MRYRSKSYRYRGVCLLTALACLAGGGPLAAEYIFHRNGAIIEGAIIRDAAAAVTVKTPDNRSVEIKRADILRILYTRFHRGRVFIRLTDGSVLDGFMVDENQEQYTFRKELNSPDEFTVPRNKVIFIARDHPTDLAGSATDSYIDISWNPPYMPPSSYNIYCKSGHDQAFRIIANTADKRHRIDGLAPDTRYSLYITAIDQSGRESFPTETISLQTTRFSPRATPNSARTDFSARIIPVFALPLAKLDALTDSGYGGLFTISRQGVPLRDLSIGARIGWLRLPGKSEGISELTMAPLCGEIAARIISIGDFHLSASCSLGFSYNRIRQDPNGSIPERPARYNVRSGIDPLAGIGCSLEYRLTPTLACIFSADALALAETRSIWVVSLYGIGISMHL